MVLLLGIQLPLLGCGGTGCPEWACPPAPLTPAEVTAPPSPSPEPQSQRGIPGWEGELQRCGSCRGLAQAARGGNPEQHKWETHWGLVGEIMTTDGARPGLDYCKITAIAAVYNSSTSNSFFYRIFFLIVSLGFYLLYFGVEGTLTCSLGSNPDLRGNRHNLVTEECPPDLKRVTALIALGLS